MIGKHVKLSGSDLSGVIIGETMLCDPEDESYRGQRWILKLDDGFFSTSGDTYISAMVVHNDSIQVDYDI